MIHLCAPSDRNGNPRRAFLLINDDNNPAGLWPEGYDGHHAVPGLYRQLAANAVRINVSAGELKAWLASAVAVKPYFGA